jgi:hypothetical protein
MSTFVGMRARMFCMSFKMRILMLVSIKEAVVVTRKEHRNPGRHSATSGPFLPADTWGAHTDGCAILFSGSSSTSSMPMSRASSLSVTAHDANAWYLRQDPAQTHVRQ